MAVENPNFSDEQEASKNAEETEVELGVGLANDVPKVVGNQAGHVSFGDM